MRWEELLSRFSEQPLFHTSHLGVFPDSRPVVLVQLSRWINAGKLAQLRRGWYLIQKPFRTKELSAAFVANTVVRPSYLSLEWALQYHGMIPDAAFQPTSITTRRGVHFTADDRYFLYHHVSPRFFHGYGSFEYSGERIIIATPEKSLLDHIYIFALRNPFSILWLEGLRLQNLDRFDIEEFRRLSSLVLRPGFSAAVETTAAFLREMRSRI